MKYCQGPKCHTYRTKDRLRGPKGAKTYQTRRRTDFYYLGGNACDMRCQNDWFQKFGEQAVNHFGRIHEPIKLTEDNAWIKDYDYNWNSEERQSNWHWLNTLTDERRPLTREQYNDKSLVRPN
jgi:hypothetical protein